MLHIDVSDNVLVDILHYNLSQRWGRSHKAENQKIFRRLLLNVFMTRDWLSWCYLFYTSSTLTKRHAHSLFSLSYQLFFTHTTVIFKRLFYMHVLESVFSIFYNGVCVFLLVSSISLASDSSTSAPEIQLRVFHGLGTLKQTFVIIHQFLILVVFRLRFVACFCPKLIWRANKRYSAIVTIFYLFWKIIRKNFSNVFRLFIWEAK